MDVRMLTKMALLVALLCVSAYISFPIPFSPAMVTLLTFTMCLVAFLLPPKQTFIVLIVYLLLGAVGLPVFTGGKSGIAALVGPTGGYYLAWPVAYTLLSIFKGTQKKVIPYTIRAVLITVPITYIGGMIGLMIVLGFSLEKAFMTGALPFIFGDTLKAIVAAWLATKIRI